MEKTNFNPTKPTKVKADDVLAKTLFEEVEEVLPKIEKTEPEPITDVAVSRAIENLFNEEKETKSKIKVELEKPEVSDEIVITPESLVNMKEIKELSDIHNDEKVEAIYNIVKESILSQIKEVLEMKGMTKKDLAYKLGVTPVFASKILNGTCFSLKTVIKVLVALDCDLKVNIKCLE